MSIGDFIILALAGGITGGYWALVHGFFEYRAIIHSAWSFVGGVTCFTVLIGSLCGLHWVLDRPVPGAFFEKGEYKSRVYVYASRIPNEVTNYRVPAAIERISDGGTSPYLVHSMFMPNGGVIHLENADTGGDSDPFTVLAYDQSGREWKVVITSEVAP